jgi:purine-binding chemotaxis protein CheW
MGRMADARKKSRQGKGPGSNEPADTAPPTERAAVSPPEPEVGPEPERPNSASMPGASEVKPEPAPDETAWVSREESFVFPADAPTLERAPRLSLPASGLAADILALAEVAAVPSRELEPQVVAPEHVIPDAGAARSHNISFFASPGREEKRTAEATEHLATFFLGREEYGVDVRLVQEIIRVTDITQVPRAPGFIKGVINLRGRIIPVVDLRRKLNLGEVQITKHSRIVVVKVRDRLVGLLVDGASQVLKVAVSTIEQAPEEVVEIDANYIRGVAKLQNRLIILMDLQKILAMELREGAGAIA